MEEVVIVNNRKLTVVGLTTTMIIILVILSVNTLFYYNDSSISIYSDEELSEDKIDDKYIELDIECRVIYNDPNAPKFITDLSFDEIFKSVKEKYDKSYIDSNVNAINIVADNKIYSLIKYDEGSFLWQDRNYYKMNNNELHFGSEYEVVFPVFQLEDGQTGDKYKFKVKCTFDELKEFYSKLENVDIGENRIVIERYGKKNTITYSDYKVVIE